MSSNDFFEQLDLFDWFKDVVDTSIHELISISLGLDMNSFLTYSSLSFYPIYTRCRQTQSKMLKTLNIKHDDIHSEYIQIEIDEIEKSGASWEEFIDFLILSDAKFVDYKRVL